MRLVERRDRHRMGSRASPLPVPLQLCGTHSGRTGSPVLEEAAEAMGGLEELEGIENITHKEKDCDKKISSVMGLHCLLRSVAS